MRKILFIIIVTIFLFIINDLSHSIYDIWHKIDFVTKAEKELEYQKQQSQRLKSELSYAKTEEFIEKETRNKLFMVKTGEQKILIPKESEKGEVEKKDNVPNWKQWWDLFF